MELTDTITTPAPEAPTREASRSDAPSLRGDRTIWGIYILLCLISLVELYSASSQEVDPVSSFGVYGPIMRHAAQLLMGLGLLLFIQARSYTRLILWGPGLAVVSFMLMVAVLFVGKEVNGARRCLDLMVFTLYPSELIKMSAAVVIALIMAYTHAKSQPDSMRMRGVWFAAGSTLLFSAILITQGLTNTILLMGISMAMLIVGGVKWTHLGKVLGLFIVGAVALFGITVAIDAMIPDKPAEQVENVVSAEQREMFANIDAKRVKEEKPRASGILGRLQTWIRRLERHNNTGTELPKYKQPINDLNRQEMYGYMAQAHGGVRGVLPGNSRETARLPLAFSDYIYSIIVEEWGLIGGLLVMVLYLVLLARASSIASRCTQRFAALLVIGMAVMIVLQALFHMAIVTGFFPVSGQPLPLISKGGTSILVTSAAFGVMLSVSRFGVRTGRKQDDRAQASALPEGFRSDNPTQL